MPEDTPPTPPVPQSTSMPSTPPASRTDFHIGEEFGTAKKNLPPVKIILIGVAIIAVVAGIVELAQRPTSEAVGLISDVTSVEVPNQNSVMVVINVFLQNHGEKSYWIHTIQATLETAGGNFNDQAASAVDFDRYFRAFPALKRGALDPLQPETKIAPGAQVQGTVIVVFPVTPEAFANRKSLKVTIQPYDQPAPLVLTK
jgi:hypothetical protein